MAGAVGQQRVPRSYLEEYVIDLPSLDEQKEILKIVDDCILKEQAIEALCEKIIEDIQIMKKSILAKVFRGELGTNDSSDEDAIELLKSVLEVNL